MRIVELIFGVCLCLLAGGCAMHPAGSFRSEDVPPEPDYRDADTWAALPFKVDSADVVPDHALSNSQDSAEVDVFYVYPTTYTGKRGQRAWNADVNDDHLNVRTDRTAIRNQASVFNGTCKVYAPRYRQAHLECFYTRQKKDDATNALQLAYQDVRAAFEYYISHFNQGRPLIIAAHSQGTLHVAHLIREFYDGKHQVPELVAAYLIGMPVEKDYFTNLNPCKTPEQTHCFCSWRTVHEKYKPNRFYPVGDSYVTTNPLSWTDDGGIVLRSMHDGAVLRKFYNGLYPELIDAYVDDGLLRVSRPKIPGVPFLPTRNYHIADYNFFYANLRENVEMRVNTYLQSAGHELPK